MIHLTTVFAFVIGGMEAIQPAAAGVMAGLSARTVNINTFQRRQNSPQVPPQCESVCSSVTPVIASLNSCSPSTCCSASFETAYFNCLTCAEAAVNVTDFTTAQETLDELYDDCARLGIQLPVLTFPGQNTNRPLSSVAVSSASQTTVSTVASVSQSGLQSTVGPSTSPATITTSTQATSTQVTVTSNTPTPSSTSSFGIRSAETSCFNLFAVAILGTWFYFAA